MFVLSWNVIRMPKKTLALISGLVVVTIVLFIIALRAGQQQQANSLPPSSQMAHQPTPTIPAHTVLAMGPNPLTVAPGGTGKIDVTINTNDNNVTAVQLELGYDPTIVGNVVVTPGPLFTNPVVLINKNNPLTGRYTYAFGITPSSQPVKGTGIVATVSFYTKFGTLGKQTQIGLLPSSLVTARGVAQSVLKSATGTVLKLGTVTVVPVQSTTGTGAVKTTANPPTQTGY